MPYFINAAICGPRRNKVVCSDDAECVKSKKRRIRSCRCKKGFRGNGIHCDGELNM